MSSASAPRKRKCNEMLNPMCSKSPKKREGTGNLKNKSDDTSPMTEFVTITSPSLHSNSFLKKLVAYILPAGIEKARLEIFKTQISKNGGIIVCDSGSSSLTHIIVSDKMEINRAMRILKLESLPQVPFVKSQWLSLCLKNKSLLPHNDYELKNPSSSCFEKETNSGLIVEQSKKIENLGYSFSRISKKRVTSEDLLITNESDYSESDEESKDPSSRNQQHAFGNNVPVSLIKLLM